MQMDLICMQKKVLGVSDLHHDSNATAHVPLFRSLVPVGRPNMGDKELFLGFMNQIWASRHLSNDGPLLQRFERELAAICGVKHAICVSNATLGLELLFGTLPIVPGVSEVIVPSFTFVATVHALKRQGIVPVFCDIDPKTYCMDPLLIEALITENTIAIVPVHLYGRVCNVSAIEQIASDHKLTVFYDAAHAFGCKYQDTAVGSFGSAEVLSFHATKFFHSIEGGCITTNSDDIAKSVKLARNFGFAGYDKVVAWGTNAKMSEVSAAMGLVNLRHIPVLLNKNEENFRSYCKYLERVAGVELIDMSDAGLRSNFQYVVLRVTSNFSASREQVVQALHKENVHARKYFCPGVHEMEPYKSEMVIDKSKLKHTIEAAEQVIVLPTGELLNDSAIQQICEIIRLIPELYKSSA